MPCGVAGLRELGVRPCRNGIAKLGAGAGILLEGLLDMGCHRIVMVLHRVAPSVGPLVAYMCQMH